MLCEVPLTKEQQDFAAEHHGLVYKFLNDNHLPENEFYDVVIFPYLKAVQDYCNSASAQKYSFSTIAIRQMKFRLYDYFRTQARRKRNTEVISIHLGLYSDGVPLEEVLPGQDRLMQEFEMQQKLCFLLKSEFFLHCFVLLIVVCLCFASCVKALVPFPLPIQADAQALLRP